MFDIHYHLCYGLDDGPKSIEESVALIETSINEGVTHIVATPHANHRYQFDPQIVREQIAELKQRCGNRIVLGRGCDFHLSFMNIETALSDLHRFTINGGSYLLIEFPDYTNFSVMDEVLFKLHNLGAQLIITHPERNQQLIHNANHLERMIQSGCLVQITSDSLFGRFGKEAKTAAFEYLKNNWVHLIASDAHSINRRPPAMAKAYDFIKRHFGSETADRLCVSNPRAVFYDIQMPPQPDYLPTVASLGKRRFELLRKVIGLKPQV